MKLLLVAATKLELAPFLSQHAYSDEDSTVKIGENTVEILITGVGMVATAFALGHHLASNSYDLAINVGIAGSFDFNLALGDVVLVTEDIFAEQGAEDGEGFISLDAMGFGENRQFPKPLEVNTWELPVLPPVKSITVNKVHGNALSIKNIIARFNPQTESMEGAAFFYSCNKTSTPCLQIRSVSNYVERRNLEKWNIPLAIQSLNTFISKFLKSL